MDFFLLGRRNELDAQSWLLVVLLLLTFASPNKLADLSTPKNIDGARRLSCLDWAGPS